MPRLTALLVTLSILGPTLALGGSASDTDLARKFGFAPLQIYVLKPGAQQLGVADLSGNGKSDLMFWNGYQNRIELYLQPGPGIETDDPDRKLEQNELPNRGPLVHRSVPVSYRIAALRADDLTGDGKPDLVFFGEPKELVILPSEGNGRFGAPRAVRAPDGMVRGGALATGDFNHDGRTDVALLGDEILQIYPQESGGTLGKPERFVHNIPGAGMILTADLNGDQRDDLVGPAEDDEFGLRVFFQQPTGGLGPMQKLRSPKLRSVTIVHQKDAPDLLQVIEYETGRVKLMGWSPAESGPLGDWPQRLYSYPRKTTAKRRPAAVGDITGDGNPDVVVADPEAAQIVVFAGGNTALAPAEGYSGLSKATDLCIADIDGDGANEVLIASPTERMLGVAKFADGRLLFPQPLETVGEPYAVAYGSLKRGAKADTLVYLTRHEKKLEAHLQPRDGAELTLPLDDVDDDPLGVWITDLNQDGRNDLLIFIEYSVPVVLLQDEGGTFTRLKGATTRDSLVKEATPAAAALADVDGDGHEELILAKQNLVRVLSIQDGAWTVRDQYNPPSASADLGTVAVLGPAELGKGPRVCVYDRQSRELVVFSRGENGGYEVAQTMPLGALSLSAALPVRLGEGVGLALVDPERLVLLTPDERGAKLKELASYESTIKDAWLMDSVVGDLNHDGQRDAIVVDIRKANLILLTQHDDNPLTEVMHFQVFQGKRFSGAPDRGGEPREVVLGDLNADGMDDIALLVHDRLIVYPSE